MLKPDQSAIPNTMTYHLYDLTPTDCIRIQNDLNEDLPERLSHLATSAGTTPGISFEYETSYGVVCHLNSWVIDTTRNHYVVEIIYGFGVIRVLLYLNGEKHLLETEYQTCRLKPLAIEDNEKKNWVKSEAIEALDVLNSGMYHFDE
ncbi:hypothetical protein EUZ85_15500 [Hahella sp. KA22]|uniref:hypothetical protein n=1 Tax=Hahella sp. KA22 TaxID=1628392 RepID=UPI000FDF1C94|nr:hypothetical protein [Hahella sp. KA22]AZZ92053.1 hypothetical protein ENC22_12935 [Hahella sp. KA22]QAY55424.1 hypothetical protein EUZ85_15500 [Hahella sp. KA22]